MLLVADTTTAWILRRPVLRDRSTSPWTALLAGVGALVWLAATVVGLGALTAALWPARRPSEPATRPEAPAAGRPAPTARPARESHFLPLPRSR